MEHPLTPLTTPPPPPHHKTPHRAMLRILGEDKVMVEQLRPDLIPTEYSVRADLPQVAFR